MSEITVSVIVPMYNVEEYVVEMLNSLKSQKLKGIEFILIDDGSTDNTLGRVKKETSLDSRFKILATKNNGVSSARNTGIKNSLGRYIAFLDGDDCFCEDALEKLHSSAILTQAEITYGKIKRFDATNDWYSQSHLSHGLNQSGEKSILVNPELFYSIGPGAKLYKRSLLKDIRFPEDISFGEDQVVTFDTYVKAKKIICIPEDIYLYRVRATKDSATQSLKKNCINYMEDLIKVTSINLVSLSDNNQLTIDQKNIILSAYFERVLKYEVYPIFRVGLKSVFTKEKVLEIMNRWLENIPLLVKKNMPSIVNLLLVDLSKYLFLINGKNRDAFKKLTLNVEKVDSAKATKRNRDLFKQRSEYIEAKVIKRTYLRLNLLAKYIYRRYKIRSKLFIFYFYLGKALPIKKNLVVVATSRLNFSKGNLDEISKRLQKNDELRIETLKNFNAGFRENCKKYYLLSRAKVIIVDDYFYPLYNKPLKSKQNYVQVWHGAGAYKKFGYSALRAKESNSEEFERRAHSQYTHVITSSEWAREKFSEAFNINIENVLALGFPRTDQFFNQKFIETTNNKFKELFPNLIDKKIILYAPTFRGSVVKRRRFEKKYLGKILILMKKQ